MTVAAGATDTRVAQPLVTNRRTTLMALAGAWLSPSHVMSAEPLIVAMLLSDPDSERDIADTERRLARELAGLGVDNLRLDARGGRGRQLMTVAKDLVARKPAVIVTWGEAGIRAASEATQTIPIVAMTDDPVRSGFALELRRPGGNVTGVSSMSAELDSKRLDMLADILPKGSKVLLLAERVPARIAGVDLSTVAQRRGLDTVVEAVGANEEFEPVLRRAKAQGTAGINVLDSLFMFQRAPTIIDIAARLRLPVIYPWGLMAERGGLVGYGPDNQALFRQFAGLVQKILRGAKVSELPIEQPAKFKLAINLSTARELQLRIPDALLLRADLLIR